jgi:asparagine synthase (glutamine-hydrolysing)
MIDICNLSTLRYDPLSTKGSHNVRDITVQEILSQRQYNELAIPPSVEIEKALGTIIRRTIEDTGVDCIVVALSAGVDSTLVLSLIRKEYPTIDIKCINVSFDSSNEVFVAKQISESQNAGFYEIHIANPLRDLPRLLSLVKEPKWNIYQYYFIKEAKSLSDLLFTGDGGDELFGGYTFRYKKFLDTVSPNSTWLERVQKYLSCHERDWVPDQEKMFGEKMKFSWSSIYKLFEKYFNNSMEPLDQLLAADYHGKLMYDFIPTNEKYFDYFNITGAAPLLEEEIISLSVRIPPTFKYDAMTNTGKLPLRNILKRNLELFSAVEKKKTGYGMDLTKLWFRAGKEIVVSNLDKGRIFEDKIINREWYLKSLNRIDENNDIRYISKMLQLLSLEIWYKLFVTCEIKDTSFI